MEKRFLTNRWLSSDTQPIPIYDNASVSSARQRVREVGEEAGLGRQTVESAALIASELTHNQLAHARHGYFAVKAVERNGVRGLELKAADVGPGIEKPSSALKDTTVRPTGSLGAGLAAVGRMSDELEFDDRIAEGCCITARKFDTAPDPLCCETAIMGRPYPGEPISGDDAVFFRSESGLFAAVADGLGHGPEAREASNRAIETLAETHDRPMDRIAAALNEALLDTRGCAMSLVRFDAASRMVQCISAADVRAHLYTLRDAHFLASTPVILGKPESQKQRWRIETAAVQPGSVLVMFTDGLKSRANLKGMLDVLRQPTIAIAEFLLENEARPDDDALIFVARFRS